MSEAAAYGYMLIGVMITFSILSIMAFFLLRDNHMRSPKPGPRVNLIGWLEENP